MGLLYHGIEISSSYLKFIVIVMNWNEYVNYVKETDSESYALLDEAKAEAAIISALIVLTTSRHNVKYIDVFTY